MRTASEQGGLQRLRELLRERGGLIATLLEPAPASGARGGEELPSRAAQLASCGPRAAAMPGEYELLVEAVYEGYLLHYESSRLLRVSHGERELGLLAGDQLYAIGLARLVAIGDALAVSELADTISLSSLAQADGREALAEAVWEAGACAVGWGPSEAHSKAKELALEGSQEALDAMRTSVAAGPIKTSAHRYC
jgi:hypothetical protein